MINYIRHDEQFFGTLKLSTGEEVLGELLVSQCPETHDDMIFIQHPAKTKVIETEDAGEHKVVVGFMKWMNFSDEEFYVIDEDAVVSIAPMSKEAIRMYSRWVKKEILHEPEAERGQVPVTPSMGLVAKVEDARKHLEKIFKQEPERPSNP
jgi:hypothetical protein